MTESAATPQSGALTPAARVRSLVAILVSAFSVGLTLGMAWPLITLRMEAAGLSSLAIGTVAAASPIAILLVGPLAPRIAGRLGTLPCLFLGSALAALSLAAFPSADTLIWMVLLRFAMGAGGAIDWIVSETWINTVPTEASRGRVVSLYASIWAAGIATGPIVLTVIGTTGDAPFYIAAGILAVAYLPTLAARRIAPTVGGSGSPKAIAAVAGVAGLALAAAFLSGFGESIFFSLFPVYGLAQGYGEKAVVLLISAGAVGGIALQLPLGWLADHTDRRGLIVGVAASATLIGLAIPASMAFGWLAGTVLFLWGGAMGGLYSVGLILLGQKLAKGDLATANATFIMSYTVGMIAGPVVGGIGMDIWDPQGFVAVIVAAPALLLVIAFARRTR